MRHPISNRTLVKPLALLLAAGPFLGNGCALFRDSGLGVTDTAGVIKSEIDSRIGPSMPSSQRKDPYGSTFSDSNQQQPLSVDTAIQTALTNNDAFQATLAQMGMADGDYLQSTLLTNPNFVTMIPLGVKQWEWTLFVPIEAFLLRPERMDLANSDRQRIANQLVQNGLTLVRDVTVAYTNLALATTAATKQNLLSQTK